MAETHLTVSPHDAKEGDFVLVLAKIETVYRCTDGREIDILSLEGGSSIYMDDVQAILRLSEEASLREQLAALAKENAGLKRNIARVSAAYDGLIHTPDHANALEIIRLRADIAEMAKQLNPA